MPFGERFAVAAAALAEGYAKYDLKRNKGLTAFITKAVNGAICDAITDHTYNGIKNESRAARADRAGHRPIHGTYNGVEGSHYDCDGGETKMGGKIPGWIAADEHEIVEISDEPIRATRTCADPDVSAADHANASQYNTAAFIQRRLSERLARIGRAVGAPKESIGIDENPRRNGGRPVAKLQRESLRDFSMKRKLTFKKGKPRIETIQRGSRPTWLRYGKPVAHDYRDTNYPPETRCDNPLPLKEWRLANPTPAAHLINAPTRGNASPLGIVGWLAKDADRRAVRRIKEVGRVAAAQEIAAKAPLPTPHQDAIAKPTQFRKSKKYAAQVEADLAQVRLFMAGHYGMRPMRSPSGTHLHFGRPRYEWIPWPDFIRFQREHAENVLRHSIKWAEHVPKNPQLRIIEGTKHAKFIAMANMIEWAGTTGARFAAD